MRPAVARLGARTIDRYLRNCVSAAQGTALGITSDGVYVEVQGEGVLPVEGGLAAIEKGVRFGPEVIVLVTNTPISEEQLEEHLRSLTGLGKVWGARLPVIDATGLGSWDPRRSQYNGVGLTPEETGDAFDLHQHSYHLDSNVLLDLERAHRGQLSPTSSRYIELQRMVASLLYEEFRPGVAIAELSLVLSTGQVRRDRHASLINALDAWWSHGLSQVLDTADLASRSSATATYPMSFKKESESSYRSLWERDVMATYASLLKLNELWMEVDGFKEKQRLALFARYCEWAANDLRCISAYATQIAADLLVGSRSEYARSLLKFGKQRQRNLVGAAWDITHIAVLDLVQQARVLRDTSGVPNDIAGTGSGTPILITGDQAIVSLRGYFQVVGTINDQRAGISSFYPHKLLLNRTEEILAGFQITQDAALSRSVRAQTRSEADVREWRRLVQEMENRL